MTLTMNIGKIRTKRIFDPSVRLNVLKKILGTNISATYRRNTSLSLPEGFNGRSNFRKFKVALNPMYRILLNFV